MANADNLTPHQFTAENQPKKRRSRGGVPNRATVFKNLLKLEVNVLSPDGKKVSLTVYEAAALAQIRAAMRGNTRAWIEIQDSLFGKQQNNIGLNLSQEQLQQLTDKELDQLISELGKLRPQIPRISIIEVQQRFEERRRQVEDLDDD